VPGPLSNLEVNSKNLKYAERILGEILTKLSAEPSFMQTIFPRSSRLKFSVMPQQENRQDVPRRIHWHLRNPKTIAFNNWGLQKVP
jgi:hypothetical protein